jgi:hypothetical protein
MEDPMNVYLIALLCSMSFIAGCVLTLVVTERAMTSRERQQAQHRRELTELNETVEQRLRLLAAAEETDDLDYDQVA